MCRKEIIEAERNFKKGKRAFSRAYSRKTKNYQTSKLKEGYLLLKKSADLGYGPAWYALAQAYEDTGPLGSNRRKALAYYKKAASLGVVPSYNSIGFYLFHGLGTPRNRREGIRWFKKSAESGDVVGICNYASELLKSNPRQALSWYRKAARMGSSDAMIELGKELLSGRFTKLSEKAGVGWLKRAARFKGWGEAQYLLGQYFEKKGTAKSLRESLKWYRRAASLGWDEAYLALQRHK